MDFAAFVFAQDDWTSPSAGDPGTAVPGQASPRDNVVFEAGLFGGALGMRRTFILHANGAKLPTDLLGLTSVRYDPELSPHELKTVNQKVRKAIEAEGRLARIEGLWWQYSLTARTEGEPSAVSLLRISRDRSGGLEVQGRAWQEDGTLSARYWSEASKARTEPDGVFYFWNGSDRATRMRRSSKGPVRSSWSPRTAPVATGRRGRKGTPSCVRAPQGSTSGPTRRTWSSSTAATRSSASS